MMPEAYHRARLVPHVAVWFSPVTIGKYAIPMARALALEGRREPVIGSRGIR
jgi:hypothetical protein